MLNQTVVNMLTAVHGEISNIAEIVSNHLQFSERLARIMRKTFRLGLLMNECFIKLIFKVPIEYLANTEVTYSRVALKELSSTLAPFMNWTDFFGKFLRTYNSTETIDENVTIIVLAKEYFKNLSDTIKNESEQTVQMYAYINLLKYMFPFLSQEFSTQVNALSEAMTGASQPEKSHVCIEHVDNVNTFGYATGRVFIRKKFSGVKSHASDMIDRLRSALSASFPRNSWMDEETRVLADDKLQNILQMIGYPDFILDDEQLNKKYGMIEI